ncbi:sigma factor-like helix-turn-helix DNA-binding protein [Actinoplanes sp. NPDC051633]|uniref:RNA polymerase sigma factor n=1 Tax=Actinoplanes sp. NPDC051633 TaxID=3155670 RepID=UPI00342EA94A
MPTDDDQALHEFVCERYRDLRRSAFLMGGDWVLADEVTRAALASLVAESGRGGVDNPQAYVCAEVMSAFHHRRARREHVFVATPEASGEDPVQTILVLDALHELSPQCRAVIVLRHWEGFEVDEIADILDLSDERVEAYAAAGAAALSRLLAQSPEAAEGTAAPAGAEAAEAAEAVPA